METLQEPLDIEAGVKYLRLIAKRMELKDHEAIVCFSERKGTIWYHEYCTAIPHSGSIHGDTHARYISVRTRAEEHRQSTDSARPAGIDLNFRMEMLKMRGEQCFELEGVNLHEERFFVNQGKYKAPRKTRILVWDNPAPLFADMGDVSHCHTFEDGNYSQCACLVPQKPTAQVDKSGQCEQACRPMFRLYKSTNSVDQRYNFDLYIKTSLRRTFAEEDYDERFFISIRQSVPPSLGSKWLRSSLPDPDRVWDYIRCVARSEADIVGGMSEEPSKLDTFMWTSSRGRAADLISKFVKLKAPKDWLLSLELVGVIDQIYKGLPGATISLEVIEYPVLEAHWTPLSGPSLELNCVRGTGELLKQMNRQSTFACVAMMQTGASNLEPGSLSEVMAISSANSIFVAASILSDPGENTAPWDLRHIIGNVGYAGLSLVTGPPGELKISYLKNEVQVLGNRSGYNNKR